MDWPMPAKGLEGRFEAKSTLVARQTEPEGSRVLVAQVRHSRDTAAADILGTEVEVVETAEAHRKSVVGMWEISMLHSRVHESVAAMPVAEMEVVVEPVPCNPAAEDSA